MLPYFINEKMCPYRHIQKYFVFAFISFVFAQWQNKGFSNIESAVPGLAGLQSPSNVPGGWSYYSCCRLAVNESLTVENDTLEVIPGRFLKVHNVSEFMQSQFPCNAIYNGSSRSAPDVIVPFRYCKDVCHGGWMRSKSFPISQWALPFVGFILPAVFFCFAVPRTRRVRMPDFLFPKTSPELLYKVPLALAVAAVDIVVLVSLVMTQAGPMVLSGLHEALLAGRVLDYLEEQNPNRKLETQDRVRLLFTLLVSNLQQERAWEKVERVVEEFSLSGNEGEAKAKLHAMLDSQIYFGLSVGAPTMIYTAAFAYTIIEIRGALGDNDTSQALAFGELWLTVPHATIVSSCLLGGNNPNTLQLLAPDPNAPKNITRSRFWNIWIEQVFVPIFASTYQPHWMWNRGRSTSEWFSRIIFNYPEAYSGDPGLGEILEVSVNDWAVLNLKALALISVPCVLGGLTAYTTPPLCVSCRSLSILVYLWSEIILIMLQNWDYACWGMPKLEKNAEWVDQYRKERIRSPWLETIMLTTWRITYSIATLAALLSAIGGTLLQLIGVFRTCLCSVPIQYWSDLSAPAAVIPVGSNSAAQQRDAERFWEPTGITATLFLAVTCFYCWWYQTRLRIQYEKIVESSLVEKGVWNGVALGHESVV